MSFPELVILLVNPVVPLQRGSQVCVLKGGGGGGMFGVCCGGVLLGGGVGVFPSPSRPPFNTLQDDS